LHGGGVAVGPGVVRDELKLDLAALRRAWCEGGVEFVGGGGIFCDGAFVLEDDDTTEKVGVEMLLELRGGFCTEVERDVIERDALGLIELLEAINERATLDCDATVVVDDASVGFENLRGHVEFDADGVTRRPAALQGEVVAGRGPGNGFAVDLDLRAV